ncbi:MAG: amidohydrolase family protein [Planctomycetes bacterium]|nr:amidohydrolase family protein [Planctomycetota bacterium]
MRTPCSPSVLPFTCLLALGASLLPAPGLRAQQGEPAGKEAAATQEAPAPRRGRQGGQGQGQGQRRRQPIVIEAGTVHPASGPAIEDGVVVIRGNRIVAVGKKGEVEIPEGAATRSYPTGHVYPGLVDAETDAYTDPALRGEGNLDAGLELRLDLRAQNERDDALAAAGITTAYVTVRSPAQLRGQGAIVRPRAQGFDFWPEKDAAAVQMRLTNGPTPSHALQRLAQFEGASKMFEGLDDYRKAKKDYTEALLKYEKDFQEYLDYHEKKKGSGEAKPGEAAGTPANRPAGATPEGAPRVPGRGRRGTPPGGGGGDGKAAEEAASAPVPVAPEKAEAFENALLALIEAASATTPETAPQDPPQGRIPPRQGPSGQGPGGQPGQPQQGQPAKEEGPKRPTYPKKPNEDPTKEALLRVLDGELALRVEAHRPDEVRAALAMQKEHEIPLLVIEQAYGAADAAATIAAQGAMVVLTEVLPGRMPKVYESFDVPAVPAALQRAGASFAIASGAGRRASCLRLMAATAIAGGLDADAALRAITLTPAEILGVAKDTGSLTAGKFADVLVTDRSLFASDSHVLLVLSQGRTEFEAK